MAKLCFQIKKKYRHPVISVPVGDNKNIRCLIDTGASIPVWCGSTEIFQLLFPEAKNSKKKSLLRGFGGEGKEVEVWIIPEFVFKDTEGTDKIIYHNFHVMLDSDRNFGCDLILSYEMFKEIDYSFDNSLDPEVTFFTVKSDRVEFGTGMRTGSDGFLSYFYVFSE